MRKRDLPWKQLGFYFGLTALSSLVMLVVFKLCAKHIHFQMIDSLDSVKITDEREYLLQMHLKEWRENMIYPIGERTSDSGGFYYSSEDPLGFSNQITTYS